MSEDNHDVKVTLQPLGHEIIVKKGTPLKQVLFEHGVEFPCGGQGTCGQCKVQVSGATVNKIGEEEEGLLSALELENGWRLSCRQDALEDMSLHVGQWAQQILVDNSDFHFEAKEGYGVAVDLGTTTLAAQLIDLKTAQVLEVETDLNKQVQFGADVMSRICTAVTEGRQQELTELIRSQIFNMIKKMLDKVSDVQVRGLRKVVIVGNTPMHNIFCGIDLLPMSQHPFDPDEDGLVIFDADTLGWDLPGESKIHFLPCLGGFVGSDILAGMLATKMHLSEDLEVFVDLGTNGEVLVGSSKKILCASTAAGPAFEAAKISMGMRASTGAISEVKFKDNQFHCNVIGNAEPRGLCGSGLVDATAAVLDAGKMVTSGRFCNEAQEISLMGPVKLSQTDVRELQLAKGAVCTGIEMLIDKLGFKSEDVKKVYIAGAFGNYINYESAQKIGLFKFPKEKVASVGNTALLGAKLALFDEHYEQKVFSSLQTLVEHIPLNTDLEFQDKFVDNLCFPEPIMI